MQETSRHCGYANDLGKLLSPRTDICWQLQAVATSSYRMAPQHKPWFPAHPVAPTKPSAPITAKARAPTIFSRPITPVTAPAQPTTRPTSSHTTPAVQPTENVSPTQRPTQQSPAAGCLRTRSISIAATAPDPVDDSSSSEDDASNNPSHRFASRTLPRSFRRSQSVASTGTSVMGDSKLKIHKLEKYSGVGKWTQAAVFDNWVDDVMD